MNCEDFNEIINELADYKPMAVSTRDAGVSHVALCADCAAKLANARAVSGNLLLAAGAESEVAPTRVKENLVAAFAAQRQATQTPGKVVHISRQRNPGWWAMASAAAVAAAAVIVFAVILPFWKSAPAPNSQAPHVALKAPPISVPASSPSPNENPGRVSIAVSRNKDRGASRKQRLSRETNRRPINAGPSETVARNTSNEFLPLTYLASATAIDTGTIVRVQLSKSALVRLGLPMNLESSSESVRAEVVIGDDGVARAIRLVQ
jgi:hypothetical protein